LCMYIYIYLYIYNYLFIYIYYVMLCVLGTVSADQAAGSLLVSSSWVLVQSSSASGCTRHQERCADAKGINTTMYTINTTMYTRNTTIYTINATMHTTTEGPHTHTASWYCVTSPLPADDRRYGPVRGPDRPGLPPGRPPRGAPPGQDGAVRRGAQVPGPHPDHRLHAGLPGPLRAAGPGVSEESRAAQPQVLHLHLVQRPHGPAEGLPGGGGGHSHSYLGHAWCTYEVGSPAEWRSFVDLHVCLCGGRRGRKPAVKAGRGPSARRTSCRRPPWTWSWAWGRSCWGSSEQSVRTTLTFMLYALTLVLDLYRGGGFTALHRTEWHH